MVDISVVINCHQEGRLLHPTVKSVISCMKQAELTGISVECLLIRDNPNKATALYSQKFLPSEILIVDVDINDAGPARNQGAKASSGRYITFIDGDDLWGRNWLVAAYRFAESMPNANFVLHPEMTLSFEGNLHLWKPKESNPSANNTNSLLTTNVWSASSFAPRQVYLTFPYQPINVEGGFAYEDWHWNCEVKSAGMAHKIVPQTFHCYRHKTWQESRNSVSDKSQCILAPSKLFALAYQRD